MEDTYHLKVKLGIHEFEASGPVQVVQAQFAAFEKLVTSLPAPAHIPPPIQYNPGEKDVGTTQWNSPKPSEQSTATEARLDKIMKLNGRIVSLTIRPHDVEDAVLLLLYGQKVLRQNDSVTGAEIMSGITATGGLSIGRTDRLLEQLATFGDVIVIGEHRSKRYRLTNAGLAKVRTMADSYLAVVA